MLKAWQSIEQILFFKLIYWIARLGLGLAFVASGLRKVPGIHFTALPDSNPVGAFFSLMESMPLYWHFIGFYQIIVGILALLNHWAALSGVLMLPVTVNIFLVSLALDMRGTPVITALMLIGNIYYMLWHREQYASVFRRSDMSKLKLR